MKELVDTGLVADVTDVWEKHIEAGEYSRELMNSFSFNGRAYALPKSVNYWVVFYNKRLFARYGLEAPESWEDLLSVASTLKSNGVTPFGLDVDNCSWCGFIWFQEMLVRTDPRAYVLLTTSRKVRYNGPEVREALLTWKKLLDAGYFTAPGKVDINFSGEQFARGEFAMYLMGDWWTANVERAGLKAEEDYGIFVMPGITDKGKNALIIEGRPVLVAEKSPYKAEALEIADYFMSVEAQTLWAGTSNLNSPNLKVAEETRPAHLRKLASDVAGNKYNLFIRYWEATPTQIVEPVVDLLTKFVRSPRSYEEVMRQAASVADSYWDTHP